MQVHQVVDIAGTAGRGRLGDTRADAHVVMNVKGIVRDRSHRTITRMSGVTMGENVVGARNGFMILFY